MPWAGVSGLAALRLSAYLALPKPVVARTSVESRIRVSPAGRIVIGVSHLTVLLCPMLYEKTHPPTKKE